VPSHDISFPCNVLIVLCGCRFTGRPQGQRPHVGVPGPDARTEQKETDETQSQRRNLNAADGQQLLCRHRQYVLVMVKLYKKYIINQCNTANIIM